MKTRSLYCCLNLHCQDQTLIYRKPNTLTSQDSFPPEPQVDIPFIPVPDYIEEEPSDQDETDIISEPPVSTDVDSESNQSLASQQGVDDAYAELYDTRQSP